MTLENFATAFAWIYGSLAAIVLVGSLWMATQGEKPEPPSDAASVLAFLAWAWLLARYCL